jgi:hypothetical protein
MRSLPASAPLIPNAECLKGSRLVEAMKHFIKSAFRLRRFFTPHFWKMRAYRPAVASAMQNLLPAPYDPYAIELQSRAKVQPSGHNTSALEDDSWTPVLGKLSAKALDRRFASVGAIELGAWAAEDVHSAFASIDHDVIAAIAHRTGGAIDSFSDLSQSLAPHTIAERLQAASPFSHVDTSSAALRPLVGSIGEETVLRHLQEAGVDSHLAPHLNTPGWDLTVWNHTANVKTWSDVSNLSSHFDRYPSTPVVVPGDATGIPEHALHFDPTNGIDLDGIHDAVAVGSHGLIIADDAMSGAAIHDHLQHAETLATHGESVFHGHLPFVTMALSGFREVDLLLSGRTDFASAAKNTVLDTTGTGVGGAVGAKAGAILGTIIFPGIGTVIGGIAGGIFGAMKGRELTGEVKQRAFKEALSHYEGAATQFQSQARTLETEASRELNKARRSEQLSLKDRAKEARHFIEQTRDAVDSWVTYNSWIGPVEASDLLLRSSKEIDGLNASIHSAYRSIPLLRRFLWPDISTLAHQEALLFLRQVQKKLAHLASLTQRGQPVSRGELMALLGAVGLMKEQVFEFLERIYSAQRKRDEQTRRLIDEALSKIVRERQKSERRLQGRIEALRNSLREAMQPIIADLNERVALVRSEGSKLGYNL